VLQPFRPAPKILAGGGPWLWLPSLLVVIADFFCEYHTLGTFFNHRLFYCKIANKSSYFNCDCVLSTCCFHCSTLKRRLVNPAVFTLKSSCLQLRPMPGAEKLFGSSWIQNRSQKIFNRGSWTFVQGVLNTKTLFIYSISYFSLGRLGAFFGGAKPTKALRGDGIVHSCEPALSSQTVGDKEF